MFLITGTEIKKAFIPEELLIELIKSLRTKGKQVIYFGECNAEVEGLYIPAKNTKNTIVVLSDVAD